ncbi:hypothetical protein OH76DRAFT_188861 [Lentinus brumalis]|uniref:Uncharacterized protein n=1 Tax=Lentinus brumalis TaxID=2498619 RepID=A0A371CMX9_9APHY|nr:hypothetical protein OH76DRAFT_188861 [Polyporus brumalis]
MHVDFSDGHLFSTLSHRNMALAAMGSELRTVRLDTVNALLRCRNFEMYSFDYSIRSVQSCDFTIQTYRMSQGFATYRDHRLPWVGSRVERTGLHLRGMGACTVCSRACAGMRPSPKTPPVDQRTPSRVDGDYAYREKTNYSRAHGHVMGHVPWNLMRPQDHPRDARNAHKAVLGQRRGDAHAQHRKRRIRHSQNCGSMGASVAVH